MTTSLWSKDYALPLFSSLRNEVNSDVCVIGAGIAGLTTALLLARDGHKVVVLEARSVASGETSNTTAHIVTAHDDGYANLQRLLGEEQTKLVAQSYVEAIGFIEQLTERLKINCDFRRIDGYLFLKPGDDIENLQEELQACQRIGLSDVNLMGRSPAAPFNTGPCLNFPNQATFHPLRYIAGLLSELARLSVNIYCESRVTTIDHGNPCSVITEQGRRVTCRTLVVATNSPINTLVGIHTKQAAYRSYSLAAPYNDPGFDSLFWETGPAYHYIRSQKLSIDGKMENVLIVGGEDHRTGQADDGTERLANLERWARERLPGMGPVIARWSGQVMETIDALPFLGEDRENVYVITGDSGTGIVHSTIGAMLISDIVAERNNPWIELYNPSRRTLGSLREYARENINTIANFVDWTSPHHHTPQQLRPGQATVLHQGLKRVGVFKSIDGRVHTVSLACKHLGCSLRWNSLEQSWDCPCHGSRYTHSGEVLNGPAHNALTRLAPATTDQDPHGPKERGILNSELSEERTAIDHRS